MDGYRIVFREQAEEDGKRRQTITGTDPVFSSFLSFLLTSKFSLPLSFFHLALDTPSSCHLFPSLFSVWPNEDPPCCTCAVPGVQWQPSESIDQKISLCANKLLLKEQGHPLVPRAFPQPGPWPSTAASTAAANNILRKRFFGTGIPYVRKTTQSHSSAWGNLDTGKFLYHHALQPVLGVKNHSLALDSQGHVRIPGIKDCVGVFSGYLCSGGVYNGNKLQWKLSYNRFLLLWETDLQHPTVLCFVGGIMVHM